MGRFGVIPGMFNLVGVGPKIQGKYPPKRIMKYTNASAALQDLNAESYAAEVNFFYRVIIRLSRMRPIY